MPLSSDPALTDGHLLGGRVVYRQPRDGFRSGIEPVLLAAAIPARAGQVVLEAGSGPGAGLLCLAARVPVLLGIGVERDPALAAIAAGNATANGWPALSFVAADIEAFVPPPLDHAFANPPYHPAGSPASPRAAREQAKRAQPNSLETWARAMSQGLRPRGSLTLILPAAELPAALAALEVAGCGSVRLMPLWPKPGRAAKLMLLQAIKGGSAPFRLHAGLVLHRPEGGYTPEAEAILRDGAALAWDESVIA